MIAATELDFIKNIAQYEFNNCLYDFHNEYLTLYTEGVFFKKTSYLKSMRKVKHISIWNFMKVKLWNSGLKI